MLDRQTAGCVVEKIVLPQIVSIKQASEIMKLPPYYLRRVCRENPDIAFQSGVKWYINLGKLSAYYNNKLGAEKEKAERSKLTVTIPDDLHQQIRDELERQGITTSQFIEQAITTFFEKPKGVRSRATRTLAFQVSEELLQRIKTFLARYEQIYHHKLSQKEFLVRIIERELDEAEKDYERITTEQAAEKNADVDSGEPDGTEMEVDAQY